MSIKPGNGCALRPCTGVALLVPNLGATLSPSQSQCDPSNGVGIFASPASRCKSCDEPASSCPGQGQGEQKPWGGTCLILINGKKPAQAILSPPGSLACAVCGVVAAGASAVTSSRQRMLAGATDTVKGQNPRVPAAQPALSQGNVPIYFPEAGCAAEPKGKAASCHSHEDFLCSPQAVNLVWEEQTHGNIPQGSHGLLLPHTHAVQQPPSQLGAIPQHKPTHPWQLLWAQLGC